MDKKPEGDQPAPDFARETGAPPFVKDRMGAENTSDPAGGKGRQDGDGAKE